MHSSLMHGHVRRYQQYQLQRPGLLQWLGRGVPLLSPASTLALTSLGTGSSMTSEASVMPGVCKDMARASSSRQQLQMVVSLLSYLSPESVAETLQNS